MSRNIYLELDQEAQATIGRLKDLFGTSDVASIVSHALGLAEASTEFVGTGGTLTVVDPRVSQGADDDRFVDIQVTPVESGPQARAA